MTHPQHSYPDGELFKIIVCRGSFSEQDAVNIVRQMVEGLRYLHSNGIAHRDIKVTKTEARLNKTRQKKNKNKNKKGFCTLLDALG